MNAAEVAVLLGKTQKQLEKAEEFDLIDTWPMQRRHVPADAWGIRAPGLRRAHPFDGLVK